MAKKRYNKTIARRAIVDVIKARPCDHCKRVLPLICLDIYHRATDYAALAKLESVHDLIDAIVSAKVLCLNCHREESHHAPKKPRKTPLIQTEYRAYRRTVNMKHQQKKKLLVRAAKEKPCTDCGVSYPFYCMELDHIDPAQKSFKLSAWPDHSVPDIERELLKCRLLCGVCHRLRTAKMYEDRKASRKEEA